MKSFLLVIFCSLFLQKSIWENNIFTKSNNINLLKKEASFAFWKKNYLPAKGKYLTLINDYKIKDEAVNLNLAHCYFELGDTASARKMYEKFNLSQNLKLKSIALQQLGLLAFAINNKEKSLTLTHQALQSNPYNDGARYNYEVLKRFNINENPQEPSSNNENNDQSQTNHNQQKQTQVNGKETNKASKTELKTTKNIGLSEEKAKMILDAIQSEEEEAIHKKKKSQRKNEKGKPDW